MFIVNPLLYLPGETAFPVASALHLTVLPIKYQLNDISCTIQLKFREARVYNGGIPWSNHLTRVFQINIF